jgi:hypothetical protein
MGVSERVAELEAQVRRDRACAIAQFNRAIKRTEEYLGVLHEVRDSLLQRAEADAAIARTERLDRVLDAADAQISPVDPEETFEERLANDASEAGRDYME